MPNALTREDVQDEFKQLAVEIRQIGKIVQDHVRQELRTFLDAYSSSSPSLQDAGNSKRSEDYPIDLHGASLKQPSATGISSTSALLREAAHAQDEGMLFRKKKESSDMRPPSALSAFSIYSIEDRSKIHPEEPEGGQLEAANNLGQPENFSEEQLFVAPKEKSEEDFADVSFANQIKSDALKVGSKDSEQRKLLSVNKKASVTFLDSNDSEDSFSKEDINRSGENTLASAISGADYRLLSTRSNATKTMGSVCASEVGTASWLPTYRMTVFSVEEQRRRSSIASELSLELALVWQLWYGRLPIREAIGVFFRSEYFDYFMGIFLMLNAISIGVQVNYMADRTDQTAPPTWRAVDLAFCLIFTIELLIRVALYRGQYLRMKEWQWNLFDLLVVSFSVIDELTKLIFAEGSKVRDTIDELFVLRMFRLARVVRLIRMVRLIPELKSMVYLISASMWSFFWTVVLLMILIYVVAVYYTEMATDIKLQNVDKDVEDLKENYGSIGQSMFSLFQAITGGDDWKNFVLVFKDENYLMNSLVFSVYIAFGTLVMLNLVTGVFVEGAQRIIREDKEAELVKNVRRLFHSNDTDQNGTLNLDEFSVLVEHRRMKESLDAVDMSPEQAKSLFLMLDVDNSGELTVEEFVLGCIRMRAPARSIDLSKLKYDFDEITQLWANQFATMDQNIRLMMEAVEQLAHATVASMPMEHYDV